MREKLIELIQAAKSKKQYDFLFGNIDDAIDMKSDEEYIADHLIANGVTFAEDNNVPSKWIPVTERLPEKAGWYLAYGDSKYMNMRFTRTLCWNGRWWSDVMGAGFCVTHWMPMPQPPKGE